MGIARILLVAVVGGAGYSGVPAVSLDSFADLIPEHNESQSLYQVSAVTRAELTKTIAATGTIDATINVEVGSQLSGQIASLSADFNDKVSKGQVLAQLDDRTYRTQVDSARAALEGAKADVQVAEAKLARAKIDAEQTASQRTVLGARAEVAQLASEIAAREARRKATLGGKGVIAASQVEDAGSHSLEAGATKREADANLATHNTVEQAAQADVVRVAAELGVARAAVHRSEAQLESALIDLERTRIRSPIDGVVVGRNVTQGQTLASTLETRTLFVVAGDLRRMEVYARVDESDISQIGVGQPADFTVDSFPDRHFEATVRQIRKEPKIIQNVVTYVVVLVTANDDLALLPGMTAVAKIETARSLSPVTVPLAALRFRPRLQGDAAAPPPSASTSVVWTLRGGAPKRVIVTVGSQDGERAEITSGNLQAGDRVLTGERPPNELTNPGRQGNG
jgi:HlyD family secretion protein